MRAEIVGPGVCNECEPADGIEAQNTAKGYGREVTQVANAVEISAKGGGTCARTADDRITCWGSLSQSLGGTLFKTWSW